MRIRTILYGILLYLAFEAWTTFFGIAEVAKPDLFLAFLQISPWMMLVAVLMLAVLAVVIPRDWLEEAL
jgi:hypothetical protein